MPSRAELEYELPEKMPWITLNLLKRMAYRRRLKRAEKEVQKITDQSVEQINKALSDKEEDLRKV